MKILAIYAINQHLADLYAQADRERLARQVPKGPSALSRALAAVRSAFAGRSGGNPSAAATAA